MNIFKTIQFYNYFSFQISSFTTILLNNFLNKFYFLPNYYTLNELI
jgi:hypothetical protein